MRLVRVMRRATRRDATALQIEDLFIKSFEQLHVSAQSAQMFRDQLEKLRQSADLAYIEDTYIMGGILIYCGILLPVLTSLGIPDFPSRIAWIAFAVSFPCAVGFFLARFLKERSSIAGYGWIHSTLAGLAQLGSLVLATGLFFHIWNVAGWIFLGCVLLILFGYGGYRFGIYFKPFLDIFRDILKYLSDTPPSEHKSTNMC